MESLTSLVDRVRSVSFERALGLRPPYPPVVLELDTDEVRLVRMKRRRGGRMLLEAHGVKPLPPGSIPDSIFQPVTVATTELTTNLRSLFEHTGTRPGRVSLLLPDNLAKISLIQIPEKPGSRRQLDELVRSKMRRAVPFRLEDSRLSYQLLPGEGGGVSVLVVVVRLAVVERLERALESVGARTGLVDICTPNLLNLCRAEMSAEAPDGKDTALLNCTRNYFSLVIVRNQRVIFFRCKTFAHVEETGPNGALVREVANSLSYYREKLSGEGIATIFVRSLATPGEEIGVKVRDLGCERVEQLDVAPTIELAEGVNLEPQLARRIAGAIGAAVGRSG
jgi:hypothetical protein